MAMREGAASEPWLSIFPTEISRNIPYEMGSRSELDFKFPKHRVGDALAMAVFNREVSVFTSGYGICWGDLSISNMNVLGMDIYYVIYGFCGV